MKEVPIPCYFFTQWFVFIPDDFAAPPLVVVDAPLAGDGLPLAAALAAAGALELGVPRPADVTKQFKYQSIP